MKKQVSVGLLSILIAGGLDPLVGICQTSGLTESSRILNEAVHKNSGEEKMPEETSVNTDSITHSEVEDTKTTVPKADVVPESSEELSPLQETPSSQGGENSSEIKEDTANSTTSETAVKEETDEQNVQPKTTENIDDWMPDKALQKAVATSLGVAIDQITKESILNLRTLVGKGFGIVNLTGLEYAKKLGVIWLRDNQISDVSPLQNLTSLQHLDLIRNQISDVSPLQNLTSLQSLYLNDNQISDVSSLQNLTSLQHLELSRNQISDVSSLQNLTSLQSLYLNNNQISDVSSLQNLKALQNLSLAANQISNISPLQNLTSLQYLHSDDNQISDISPLQNLTSLQTLYLNNNQISDISPLYNLYNLPVDRDIEIVAMNQHLQLPAVYVSNKNPYFISIESPIKNITSTKPVMLSPLNTSVWTGVGQSGKVEWTCGAQVPAEGTFSTDWKFLDATDNRSLRFDGTYEQPYILSKVEINAHDSTLYTGDTWNAQDNFDSAKDRNGNPANFQDIQVTGSVDTSRPGKYKITYSYGGVQKEIEVTVLQKASNSDSNLNSGENKKNENPKTLRANEKEKALPSTGEKGSVWVFVSGVMFFIFTSVLALLRFKKSK
ncbi:leucine-rich repeat domain-containing protein [uncultured Lactococcus sp.]|uniref:leucine-rich repeat domain-containing protein n=1 Tax=uncultured Lactococcus sp. TaxID=167973 RepID=UPI0027DBB3E9|nr:leucine-rich repeat domain-containing protein [uncultured Lactococcus sp.]